MPIDFDDLRATLDFQDHALRICDSRGYDQAHRDNVLAMAGLKSCEALTAMNEDFWLSVIDGQLDNAETATEVLVDIVHARRTALPASERLLLLLGFQPPSAARNLVEAARKAFQEACQSDPDGFLIASHLRASV
ncbi:hypothetical protein ACWCQW_43615 [Streptomyces mirabilis]